MADIAGSGRQQIIIINDNGEQSDGGQIEFSVPPGSAPDGGIPNLLSRSECIGSLVWCSPPDGGIPNLLKTVNNGVGGTITVTYVLPRDFRNAVQPASEKVCLDNGDNGRVVVGWECGKPNAVPRPLVSRVEYDNGQGPGQFRSFAYDYSNGRTLAGRPSQRADLGFEFVTRTDVQLGVSERTTYLQVKPYQRLVKSVGNTDASGKSLSGRSLTYCCLDAPRGARPNFVGVASDTLTRFEQGSALFTRRTSYNWQTRDPGFPVDIKLWEKRNSTLSSALPNAPGQTDWDIVADYYYDADDPANWIIGKSNGVVGYRDDTLSGRVVLEATRTNYDASHPLRPILTQKLLLASSSLPCRTFGAQPSGISDTCRDRVDGTTSYWVTTFQNPVYDAYGNLTYWEDIRTPSSSHPTTLTYDPLYNGLVASRTNALRQTVQQRYDAALRPSVIVDRNARSTSTHYDVYGRRIDIGVPDTSATHAAEWTYVGLSADPANICQPSPCYLITATDYAQAARSHSVDYYRDGFGRVVETVDHVSSGDAFPADIITYSAPLYSSDGLRLSTTEPFFAGSSPAKFLRTSYDVKNRILSVERVAGNAVERAFLSYAYNSDGSTSVTDANNHLYRFYLDARGNVIRATDAAGQDTQYFHDDGFANYRIVLPAVAAGTPSNPSDKPIPNLTELRYGFDGFGRLISEMDPLSHLTAYSYDDAGNLTAISRSPSQGAAATSRLSYSYDALDRIQTEGDGAATKVSYVYDNYGGEQPLNGSPVGRLTAVFDSTGNTFFFYDARGNISHKAITLTGLNGLCLGIHSPICGAFEYDFTYDDQNRLTSKTLPAFPTSSSPRPVQKFSYSADGTLSDIAHNGVTYAHYSGFNPLKQPGAQWLYEVCLLDCIFANKTTYGYQADHLVANLRTTKAGPVGPVPGGPGSALIVQDDSFDYDPVGNVHSITDNRSPSVKRFTYSNGGAPVTVDTDHGGTFTYDAVDRLKTWVPARLGSPIVPAYDYDALGNLIGDEGSVITYTACGATAAPAHCITKLANADTFGGHFIVVPLLHGALIPVEPDVAWSAIHDSEGKRIRLVLGSEGYTDSYEYDYKQRLAEVRREGNSGRQESYQYNYAGERTQKVSSQAGRSTTTWFIGPDFEVQQSSTDPAGTYSATWYVGNAAVITGGKVIDGQATASTVVANEGKAMAGDLDRGNPQGSYLRLADRLGSTAVMTNPQGGRATGFVDGSEVSRYTYSPWGEPLKGGTSSDRAYHQTGYDTTPVNFTAQRRDGFSGLIYYAARYYDPRTKRFITSDDRIAGRTQGFNRFAYVMNNPLRYTDPTGHQVEAVSINITPDSEDGPDFGDTRTENFTPYNAFATESVTPYNAFDTESVTPYNAFAADAVTMRSAATSNVTAFNNAAPNPNAILDVISQHAASIGIPSSGNPLISVGPVFSAAIPTSAQTRAGEEYHNSALDQLVKAGRAVEQAQTALLFFGALGALPEAAIVAGARSLTVAELNEAFAAHLRANNALLGNNIRLIENILTPAEYEAAHLAPARGYGTALERLQAESLAADPLTSPYFDHLGSGAWKGGNPDWIGTGPLEGLYFDVTTEAGAASHYARWYGENLVCHTYSRPSQLGF